MRLVIQGFFRKEHKKTLEMLELGLIVVLLIGGIGVYEFGKEKKTDSVSMKTLFKETLEESIFHSFFPVLSATDTSLKHQEGNLFFSQIISNVVPSHVMALHGYVAEYGETEENGYKANSYVEETNYEREAYVIEDVPEEMLSLLQAENGFSVQENSGFVKQGEKVKTYNWADFETTEDFISEFYTVDSVTEAVPELFEIEALLGMDMTMKQSNDKPQILIYHTHSQEAFSDSQSGNSDTTIVGAGEMLAQILTEEYGYNVIHHTGEYDVPSRDYAYSKSLPALEQILEENPTIEVIIDLHRDGVNENTRLVTDLNGNSTAKIMFFNGLSRTKKNGKIGYLENPYLQENLAFSFQMQVAANEYYPGITRKNYLNGYRYNMHLRGKSLLIELGAQTNTVEEIKNAIEPLAHILDIVLSGENT